MELTYKDLAFYLPYELKTIDEYGEIRTVDWKCQSYTNSIVGINQLIESKRFKPILKNLLKLTDEEVIPIGLMIRNVEINNATYKDKYLANEDARAWIKTGIRPVLSLKQCQSIMEYLYSIHADVNNLIENDLAVDYSIVFNKQ